MYKGLAGSSKHCGEPVELNKLNNLKGKYREKKKLALVKDATSETKVANLKENQHLNVLKLKWNLKDGGDVVVYDDENSMDGL